MKYIRKSKQNTYLAGGRSLVQDDEYEGVRLLHLIVVEGNLARAEVELDSLDVTTMIVGNEYQLVRTVSKHALKHTHTHMHDVTTLS